ncbi:MAG: hypothetical protein U1F35_06440 [Steroidobacteraceae bacterium]
MAADYIAVILGDEIGSDVDIDDQSVTGALRLLFAFSGASQGHAPGRVAGKFRLTRH